MANSPQAKKRVRQAEVRRRRNASLRSMYRTYVKKVEAAIAAGDKETAQKALDTAVSVVDTTARKGIIHQNKSARIKSRLNAKVKTLA
ncbi:MAG: 30S ribosomal protein S20 [Pseudomonadota bacterium]|nr:30S ribosomal protein S20 [Pseudomonadota bacterium]